MLSGENGLLKRAGDARDDTIVGQEKEQVELAYISAAVKKLGDEVDEEALRIELNSSVGNGKTTVSTNENNTLNVNFTDTKHNYNVNDGSVTRIADGEAPEELNIGDIITNYTSNTALPTGIDWIYFGTDDQGHQLLTTSEPIENGFTFNNTAQNWLYYCMQEGDENYTAHSSELTESNNIHLACSKYSGTVGTTAGTARSITLKDINRVVGFNESSLHFNSYTFISGDTNDYAHNNVNYYYPSFLGSTRTDYPYWAKAGETLNGNTVPTKTFLCNNYAYYKNGENSYGVYWEGTDKSWSNQSTSLSKADNMQYIVGNNDEWVYAIGDTSVIVTDVDSDDETSFQVACVDEGQVCSGDYVFCKYDSGGIDYEWDGETSEIAIRPIIVLPSSVLLEK